MSQTRCSLLAATVAGSLLLPALCVTAGAQQTTAPPETKLPLNAALVLTPEFCATKTKKGTWGINQETFPVGKAACADLEPALKGVFLSLARVEEPPTSGDAQVVLVP